MSDDANSSRRSTDPKYCPAPKRGFIEAHPPRGRGRGPPGKPSLPPIAGFGLGRYPRAGKLLAAVLVLLVFPPTLPRRPQFTPSLHGMPPWGERVLYESRPRNSPKDGRAARGGPGPYNFPRLAGGTVMELSGRR